LRIPTFEVGQAPGSADFGFSCGDVLSLAKFLLARERS
jgi:hypothetical protein